LILHTHTCFTSDDIFCHNGNFLDNEVETLASQMTEATRTNKSNK